MIEIIVPGSFAFYTANEKNKKNRSANAVFGTIIAFSILGFALFLIGLYILYRNVMFVKKCKKGSIIHYIVAIFFSFFYMIYRWIINNNCIY